MCRDYAEPDSRRLIMRGCGIICYFEIVTMSVALDIRVPIELSVSVNAGGMAHDERAFEELG